MTRSSMSNEIFLLADEPAEDSSFAWHQRIADALNGLIRSSSRGRIIGLFGTWGSGKSSVIRILEKKFGLPAATRQDQELFVFDAWVHANDPLRRSFYEELLDYYSRRGFVDKKAFEEEANKLSRKQEETETKTTPMIEPLGVALSLLFAASLSYGGYFVKGVLDEQVWSAYGYTGLLLPLVFFLWPLTLVPFSKKIGPYFFNKTIDKVKTRTIKTVDPTTIEFLEAFTKLTDTAQKKHEHKLVIVVDNLDRLPDNEILTLWATIRSFFTLEKDKKEKIWVIVPLDPAMLQRALASGKSRGTSLTQINADMATAKGLNEDSPDSRFTLNAFIEKTFEANFWVTPPVIADNHGYFTEQAQQVFKDTMTQDEYDELFYIYESTRNYGAYGGDSTPRRIKGFLNQLGILTHLWEGKGISFRTLAIYTLVRDKISDLSSFLSSMSGDIGHPIRQPQILAMKDPDWQKHFAAIFYGVEPEKALQVVIQSKLVDALANGKTDKEFTELHNINGFWHILRRAIQDNPYQWSSDYPALSSVTLYLQAIENSGTDVPASIWRIIVNGIGDVDPAKKLDNHSHEVIPFICAKAIDLGHVEKIGKLVSRIMALHDTPTGQLKADDKTRMVNTILAICRTFADKKTDIPASALSSKAADVHAPIFWPVLHACVKNVECMPYFKAIIEANSALENTVQDLGYNNDDAIPIIFGGIEALTKAGYAGHFEGAIEYFADIVKTQNVEEGLGEAALALGKMSNNHLFPKCDTSAKMTALLENGTLYGGLQNAHDENDSIAKAALMGLIMHYDLEMLSDKMTSESQKQIYQNIREPILNNAISDDELGEELTQIIQEQFTAESFTSAFSQTEKYTEFAKSGFSILLQLDNCTLNARDVIENFTTYQNFFEADTEEERKLLTLSEQQPEFWERFTARETLDCSFVEITERMSECNIKQSERAVEMMYDRLATLKTEDWKNAFPKGLKSPILQAVRFLTAKQHKQAYGAALGTALIESIDVVSAYTGKASAGFFKSLPEHLKKGEANALSKRITSDILKQARGGNWDTIDKRLEILGAYHSDMAAFKGDEGDVVSFVLMPAIEGKKVQVLSWISSQAKELNSVISKVSTETREALEERLQEALLETDYPALQQITDMMNAWGITPRVISEENSDVAKEV